MWFWDPKEVIFPWIIGKSYCRTYETCYTTFYPVWRLTICCTKTRNRNNTFMKGYAALSLKITDKCPWFLFMYNTDSSFHIPKRLRCSTRRDQWRQSGRCMTCLMTSFSFTFTKTMNMSLPHLMHAFSHFRLWWVWWLSKCRWDRSWDGTQFLENPARVADNIFGTGTSLIRLMEASEAN